MIYNAAVTISRDLILWNEYVVIAITYIYNVYNKANTQSMTFVLVLPEVLTFKSHKKGHCHNTLQVPTHNLQHQVGNTY